VLYLQDSQLPRKHFASQKNNFLWFTLYLTSWNFCSYWIILFFSTPRPLSLPENRLQDMTCLRSNKMSIPFPKNRNYYQNCHWYTNFSPPLDLTKCSFANIGISHGFFLDKVNCTAFRRKSVTPSLHTLIRPK